MKHTTLLTTGALALGLCTTWVLAAAKAPPAPDEDVQLAFSRIYWEYNATANDLGVHVTLDGEDWKQLKIHRPNGSKIFEVTGKGPYKDLGMTELFFEGAEPNLEDFPLAELLGKFPEGEYEFEGRTVDGEDIEGTGVFTHAIPDGPEVFSFVGANNYLEISWLPVTAPPLGFPNRPIVIKGYQVIVESFQLTLPASGTSVTVPPEFVAALEAGEHQFEVLAIEQGGNQTLSEGYFTK